MRDESDLSLHLGGVLVPTMGALHAGHDALIREAVRAATASAIPVVVSLFVNPAQFEEKQDFESYPDTFNEDAARCEAHGVDCIFAPLPAVVYPGYPDAPLLREPISLPTACVGKGLEDAYRPGHFDGVYRVLKRLFLLTRPGFACFGEKDWQQLILARHVAQELNAQSAHPLELTILPVETKRETVGPLSGIALSSRNVHLTPNDHDAATALYRAIQQAQQSFRAHGDIELAARAGRDIVTQTRAHLEYLEIRDAKSCGAVTDPHNARVLAAARVGATRLIDNDALVPNAVQSLH